uniref:DUF4371 domain-containing protein n=1 Tax=Sinocyclocheilus anshuiensis TaxID=1608454 RepID=A0A671L672_9TELE
MSPFWTFCTRAPSTLCFLCCELLANSAMKPSHLQRHLRTKHPHHVGNSLEFFRRKCHEFTSCQENMVKATSASAKAHKAMYAVCLLLAKAKKPFSLAEELIIPAAAVLAETMVGKTAADKIKTVPLSIDTVSCRIDKMGTDIVEQLVDKLRAGESFSLQLDESVDVSGQAQLVAYVRYVDTKHEITASMTGRIKGLIAHISQKNPDIQWTHCVIHREALASKKISPELNSILNDAVKAINFIKSQPLNARLFLRLYYGMGSEHTELLLHTEVRWLLRSKVLNRLFELRNEVCCFLSDNVSPLATLFKDNNWIAKLAYLADIFTKLNELNLSLQGRDITILKLYDRVGGSLSILHLYCREFATGFSDFFSFSDDSTLIADPESLLAVDMPSQLELGPLSTADLLLRRYSDAAVPVRFPCRHPAILKELISSRYALKEQILATLLQMSR